MEPDCDETDCPADAPATVCAGTATCFGKLALPTDALAAGALPTRGAPHIPQNRLASLFSLPHRPQRKTLPPSRISLTRLPLLARVRPRFSLPAPTGATTQPRFPINKCL